MVTFSTFVAKTTVFAVIAAFLLFIGDEDSETTVHIHPESEVVIAGTTNVNSFDCSYILEDKSDPLHVVYETKDGKFLFSKAELFLQNSGFDCGGRGINRDFQELLKTEDHPRVLLELLYAEVPEKPSDVIRAGLRITLAGVSREFETELICDMNPNLCIYGNFVMHLSDFDLEAPRKALGIIQVDDQVEVQLNIKLRPY
ncbi:MULTISPECIES: hypothetical protein [unclassified Robiginitalea]|uniref:hypothetical protein n=1 Tax=Robiginitalea TaxID=252306 RepID=UPI00234B5111|nr:MULTISPECIES: hypothetical protein [unclassified Robiginitalea]MDC6353847.1 hypothetical protein [Robiginitalea sp. PM2]MDC6374114.1 hypothetical protein [Robiginitalea sp. SP8]